MSVTEGRDAEVIPQLLVAEAQQTGTVTLYLLLPSHATSGQQLGSICDSMYGMYVKG